MAKPSLRYKPNVAYILNIDKDKWYGGCHCHDTEYLVPSTILYSSANKYCTAYYKGELSAKEYRERVKLYAVFECETPEEALDKEVEIIADLKEKYGDHCLNVSLGNKYGNIGFKHSEESRKKLSESCKGRVITKETRKKLSQANSGENNPFYGKHHSEETKQKIIKAHKGTHHSDESKRKIGIAHKGKFHSEESKRKMSEARRGKPQPAFNKVVLQLTLDGQLIAEYPSIKEASEKTGISRNRIYYCFIGKQKSTGNCTWKLKYPKGV